MDVYIPSADTGSADTQTLKLNELNERQYEAVTAAPQNMLILAGAGSGKTKVLISRIGFLIRAHQVSPFSIMAVTFTNKAAAEMRHRLESLLGQGAVGSAYGSSGMWIGTFHGLAHRFLRTHFREANLPESFQVLDSDDQHRLIRRVMKSLNLDEKRYPPKQCMWYINGKKDEGLRPKHIESFDPTEQVMLQVYKTYQEACDRAGLVDFAEILLRSHEILATHSDILNHYRKRFRHILVDEFQDTNSIQYAWIRLLSGSNPGAMVDDIPAAHVMIVGDDDQSIYGWRGARVENIHNFQKEFESVEMIRLEQNYRSTANILKAANAVIANNSDRLGKDLWTEGREGDPIGLYTAFNDLDEARFVAGNIKKWQEEGGSLSETAILYRNNAQSRVLEEALLQSGIKYRIYGGLRFFERQEIKDALAYLRMVSNRDDDAAFERVINTPARGIGEKSLQTIRDAARSQNLTMWQAAGRLIDEKAMAARAMTAVRGFMDLVQNLETGVADLPLHEQADQVIQSSGLKAMYQAEKGEKGQTRVENLEELVTACRQYEPDENMQEMPLLAAFLSHASLESGESQADAFEDAVQLMTLHSAKGLEFPMVFLVGVEEGMFPSQQSSDAPERLEEERRLAYVGMTRAMEKLFITHAESRRMYGQEHYHRPSRFISEIPKECLYEIKLTTSQPRQSSYGQGGSGSGNANSGYKPSSQYGSSTGYGSGQSKSKSNYGASASHIKFSESAFGLGQRVQHAKFGEGTVLNCEGDGDNSRIQVNFDQFGAKWLVTTYAKLTKI
ncbi:DNA helicase II [Psychrosphaera sp. B3R10]|uniref:DNA helicase II n=2 Tax=Psychrosphaera TaxID=907197 RepID=UPI001C0887D0|nr:MULTISPECIES: DNA helicase II [unclassified Psychrosphaera]MBU2883372.1 DNA helicase II [Psychrosphaera sp. I2R16]MBU2990534.1 DNA helicase II [Psychrosphaera sp. B3R10]